jgi:hypothetical protein
MNTLKKTHESKNALMAAMLAVVLLAKEREGPHGVSCRWESLTMIGIMPTSVNVVTLLRAHGPTNTVLVSVVSAVV